MNLVVPSVPSDDWCIAWAPFTVYQLVFQLEVGLPNVWLNLNEHVTETVLERRRRKSIEAEHTWAHSIIHGLETRKFTGYHARFYFRKLYMNVNVIRSAISSVLEGEGFVYHPMISQLNKSYTIIVDLYQIFSSLWVSNVS